jgi:hypothetical protein
MSRADPTDRRPEVADRRTRIARRVEAQAELSAIGKRWLEDSTFVSTAVFTVGLACLCAVVAALYFALR